MQRQQIESAPTGKGILVNDRSDIHGTKKVKAVQEPGYANVWTIQDANGSTVARMTINDEAEAWAKQIEAALNAQRLVPATVPQLRETEGKTNR